MSIVFHNEEVIGEKTDSQEGAGLDGKARLQNVEDLMGSKELETVKFIVC